MKTNKGYTLIEILIAMGILSILSGIAYVSYTSYIVSVNEKDLKLHGEMFASAIKNCTTATGGWEIQGLSSSGLPIESGPGSKRHPCKVTGTTKAEKKIKLKEQLDFTCPPEAECDVYSRPTTRPEKRLRYTCLDIRKKVSGKKLQIITRVQFDDPSDYQIFCGEVQSYIQLIGLTCKGSNPEQLTNAGLEKCTW